MASFADAFGYATSDCTYYASVPSKKNKMTEVGNGDAQFSKATPSVDEASAVKKTQAEARAENRPLSYWPTEEQFQEAIEEFSGKRLHLATGLSEADTGREPPFHCRLDFERDDKTKTWDAYIVSYPCAGHEAAVLELGVVFKGVANALQDVGFSSINASCGGLKKLGVKRTSGGKLKKTDPDDALVIDRPGSTESKYVVVGEFEFRHRSSIELQEHFQELFEKWDCLQVGIGMTVGCRTTDDKGPFGAVCFVYRRDDGQKMYVDRVFQVGLRCSGIKIHQLREKWKRLGITKHPENIEDSPDEFKTLVMEAKRDRDDYVYYRLPRKWQHQYFRVGISGSELCGDLPANDLFDVPDDTKPSSWPPEQTVDLYPVVHRISRVSGKYFGEGE